MHSNSNIDVSIIIVNFRTPQLTINCVQSIRQVMKESPYQYEIIVVDNCSGDDSVQQMQFLSDENTKIVETDRNGGFAYGNNWGVRCSQGEYLFFLNSDTLLYPDTLSEMITYMKNNREIGVMSCYMEDGDKAPLVISHSFENTKSLFMQTFVKPFIPTFVKRIRAERYQKNLDNAVFDCDWVSGAAMLIHKEVFAKIGGWDEKFFMYMEDEELCFCVHQLNLRVCVYPKMGLQHLIGKSGGSAFVAYEKHKSGILYFRRHQKGNFKIQRKLILLQARQYMKGLPSKTKKEVLKKLKEV